MSVEPGVHMRWHDLAFLHWPVDADVMRSRVPRELEVDTFDGRAWVGLVPFEMCDCRFRGVPQLESTERFYECNVRTYVRHNGRAGVWFFSLDAETWLPVLGARLLWSLPYFKASFDVKHGADRTAYSMRRRSKDHRDASEIVWHKGATLPRSRPGSIEHFLTERYYLFARRMGRIYRGRIAHVPWTLREARVETWRDGLVRAAGLDAIGEPIALCSDDIEVRGWSLVESAAAPEADGSDA
ncbi:MAG: DUF2071 domain-containing protein [Phycisphaerales bacterium]